MTEAAGNFFENFEVGQELRHATPRTLTSGDAALYQGLYGSRFALQSADSFAEACGLPAAPLDDLLVFHTVFGKTVPDVSLNAVANLGYAAGRFRQPVYPGDTLSAKSRVIGVKENSNGKTGVVYVRTEGSNQRSEIVLDYVRWVMVRKRDENAPAPEPVVAELPTALTADDLAIPAGYDAAGHDAGLAGSERLFEDYAKGEKIDHVSGVTLEEAEHMMATRLYQNTARVHFDAFRMRDDRFGRRLIYGGHIISHARSLSFNGLGNAVLVAGLNGGRHVAPSFAGDTVYAWSEVLDVAPLQGRSDVGAMRLRTIATKDRPCSDFPGRNEAGYDPAVVLDLDYWVLIPRRS